MLDWVGLLNIIRAPWRHRPDVWETKCPRDVPMPCYSTHSKYLPAQKPHFWQGCDSTEPSNLLDYSWFIPWQPLQRCSFLHHTLWVEKQPSVLNCTHNKKCCDRQPVVKIPAWFYQYHLISELAGAKRGPWSQTLKSSGIPCCQVKSYHPVVWDYYHAWERLRGALPLYCVPECPSRFPSI